MSTTKSIILTGRGDEESSNFFLSYYDGDNPTSLINALPEELASVMELEYTKFLLGLEVVARKRKIKPKTTLNRIRFSFWKEYEDAKSGGVPLNLENVSAGVCSHEFLLDTLTKPEHLAWMLTPISISEFPFSKDSPEILKKVHFYLKMVCIKSKRH